MCLNRCDESKLAEELNKEWKNGRQEWKNGRPNFACNLFALNPESLIAWEAIAVCGQAIEIDCLGVAPHCLD
jgi:hypothetical protein